ncbi:hypothetical protein TNCV_1988531 [Trichonephila clavipes]|nr:hypothetical protein TNCV_1988531 [Trichonephila clavipes]
MGHDQATQKRLVGRRLGITGLGPKQDLTKAYVLSVSLGIGRAYGIGLGRKVMTSQCMPVAWYLCLAEKRITKQDSRGNTTNRRPDLGLDVKTLVAL